jgi:hypothetical protein
MNPIEALHVAMELVKKAGFILSTASSKSEACYYFHPARPEYLLRLSNHPSKKSPIGMRAKTISKATFSRKEIYPFSQEHVENLVAMAIGRYFINEPKPSNYKGKRGTWETPERRAS